MKDPKKYIGYGLILIPLIVAIIFAGLEAIPNPTPEYQDGQELKIMTYNIHFGQGMDDLINMERIAQNILTEDPDILGLQEVDNGKVTTQGIHMAYWLANRLGMNYYYYPAENKHTLGCAILSKFPLESGKGYDIPSISIKRVMVYSKVILSTELSLDVFVLHLGISGEDVLTQANYVVDVLESDANPATPTLLMGDFNKESDSPEIQTIVKVLDDTSEGFYKPPTFPSYDLYGTQEETIDFIFASGYATILDSYVVQDFTDEVEGPAEFGSDHLPLVSIMTF